MHLNVVDLLRCAREDAPLSSPAVVRSLLDAADRIGQYVHHGVSGWRCQELDNMGSFPAAPISNNPEPVQRFRGGFECGHPLRRHDKDVQYLGREADHLTHSAD